MLYLWVGTGWTYLSSMSCVGAIFSNVALMSVCGKQPIALEIVWVVWGFPLNLFGKQLNKINHLWFWKLHLLIRDGQLWFCLPYFLYIRNLQVVWSVKIISHSVGCLFVQMMISYALQKFLSFMRSI